MNFNRFLVHSPVLKQSRILFPHSNKGFVRTFHSSRFAMAVQELTSTQQFKETIENPELVVIDFFAVWCGPCKMIAPQVDKLSTEFSSAKFFKVDVDKLSEVAADVGVRAMPTFVLFKSGKKIQEVVGANVGALRQAIQSNV